MSVACHAHKYCPGVLVVPLLTVTVLLAEIVELPAASYALAQKLCDPLASTCGGSGLPAH